MPRYKLYISYSNYNINIYVTFLNVIILNSFKLQLYCTNLAMQSFGLQQLIVLNRNRVVLFTRYLLHVH